MERSELIERTAKAIYETTVCPPFEDAACWDQELAREEARAALTVFEEAFAQEPALRAHVWALVSGDGQKETDA